MGEESREALWPEEPTPGKDFAYNYSPHPSFHPKAQQFSTNPKGQSRTVQPHRTKPRTSFSQLTPPPIHTHTHAQCVFYIVMEK